MRAEFFRNKRVLLVSTDRWRDQRVSKHHFAMELLENGAKVYFLNPSEGYARKNGLQAVLTDAGLLSLVDLNTLFRGRMRIPDGLQFIPDWLFAKRLEALCGGVFDVVWTFSPNEFFDLSVFGSALKIFHPVDRFSRGLGQRVAESADVIISVAEIILQDFEIAKEKKHLVNHGVSQKIINYRWSEPRLFPEIPNIVYVGNLLRPDLDHDALLDCVKLKSLKFTFVGPNNYAQINGNMKPQAHVANFIAELRSKTNVTLVGPVKSEDLPEYLDDADLLLYAYSRDREPAGCANSHKIMEYLASGRVIVSTPIQEYRGSPDLVFTKECATLSGLLQEAICQLQTLNAINLVNKRRSFAATNSYPNKIREIESIILNTLSMRKRFVT